MLSVNCQSIDKLPFYFKQYVQKYQVYFSISLMYTKSYLCTRLPKALFFILTDDIIGNIVGIVRNTLQTCHHINIDHSGFRYA